MGRKIDYNLWRKTYKPWYTAYRAAQARCENPKDKAFKHYGGIGIKLKMTPDDFKLIWFRDKAYKLKRASIDRINVKRNYTLGNVRYIEHSQNVIKSNRYRKFHWDEYSKRNGGRLS